MCTVSFIARRTGYALGMNRDEKLTRATALSPARHRIASRDALFPSEPGGGTWIGVNDSGATFALINWYSIPVWVEGESFSRGDVVKSILAADAPALADRLLAGAPLPRINPFRLIGVFPSSESVVEWRWNLRRLERVDHPWKINTWISSGFDEPGAQRSRGERFVRALQQASDGTADWLRRLHRSHGAERGPYSTCMHRDDAATVSYTEISVTRRTATMRYLPGAPCCKLPFSTHHLEMIRSNPGNYFKSARRESTLR